MNAFSSQPGRTGCAAANRVVRISLLLLTVAAMQLTGCTSFQNGTAGYMDKFFCGWRDHVWAKRAFRLRYATCHSQHPSHFQKGFIAGYGAICNGEDGYVPALPPRNYWGFAYQSAQGEQMVDAWYEGYPEGVRAAQQDGADQYRDIQYSRMIDDAMQQEQTGWDEAEYYQAVEMVKPNEGVTGDPIEGQPIDVNASMVAPESAAFPPMPTNPASPVPESNMPLPVSNSSWRGAE